MLESKFQSKLISEIKNSFPGCIVLKNDANYLQGFPDLLILYDSSWAALEVKRSCNESFRANQLWYIDTLNSMSFCKVVYPENMPEVMCELCAHFNHWPIGD